MRLTKKEVMHPFLISENGFNHFEYVMVYCYLQKHFPIMFIRILHTKKNSDHHVPIFLR
jgi:hypothetical protein